MSNINNFINWRFLLENKQVQEETSDQDYILLGSFDSRKKTSKTASRTREYIIKLADLFTKPDVAQILNDTNTWSMERVVFVSPTGSDTDGVVGDGNKPFNSVFVAQGQGASIIFLLPGQYSESITPRDGNIFYCYPGVEFVGGGIRDLSGTPKEVSWYGHAVFSGLAEVADIRVDSTYYIEFDRMVDGAMLLRAEGDSNVTLVCNSVLCHSVNGVGAGATFRDNANVDITIHHYYHAQHANLFFRQSNTDGYEGTFRISCPDIRIVPNYSAEGNFGTLFKCPLIVDRTDGADITVNGNLTNANNVAATGDFRGVVSIANQLFGDSTIRVNGNLDGGTANRGLYASLSAVNGTFILNGSITTRAEQSINTAVNSGGTLVGNLNIIIENGRIEGIAANIIGRCRTFYFRNCSFYNTTGTTGVFSHNTTGTTTSNVYFYDCVIEGQSGNTFETFSTIAILGCLNTTSNLVIGATATDAWGGFAQVATLVVPKIQ